MAGLRTTWRIFVFGLLAVLLASCGPQAKDLQKGERGRVARVVDGDTLEMEGGLRVHLVSVEAPRESPWDAKARAALERLALQREVELRYGGLARLPKSERYPNEAALAHVFVHTEGGRWIWAQQALLREGLVRVHTRKDNLARVDRLLADEAKARAAKLGLWAERRYQIKQADQPIEAGGFSVVEGTVRSVQETEQRLYLNFGDDYRTDFTVLVVLADLPNFTGLDPKGLVNRRVRVRGFVTDRGGPLIRADHAAQIELLS